LTARLTLRLTWRDLRVLELLDEGYCPTRIAREFGVTRQAIHKRVKKLVNLGLIKRKTPKSYPTFYELTEEGERVLAMRQLNLSGGEHDARFQAVVRPHNLRVGFSIVSRFTPKDVDLSRLARFGVRVVETRNWRKLILNVGGVTVEVTPSKIIVDFGGVGRRVSPDSVSMFNLAMEVGVVARDIAKLVADELGIDIGPPMLVGKPHFGVYDPVAEKVAEKMVVSDDVAQIDASNGDGEIDFFHLRGAKAHLLMHRRVEKILSLLNALRSEIQELRQNVEEKRDQHPDGRKLERLTDAVSSLVDSVDALVNSVNELLRLFAGFLQHLSSLQFRQFRRADVGGCEPWVN